MNKLLTIFVAALITAPLMAKQPTMPGKSSLAAPAFSTIDGNPLRINVGADNSYQVFNVQAPGLGQIYPSSAAQTADMGWFVRVGDATYAPNFGEHPGGTATGGLGSTIDFGEVSLGTVAGAGTTASPFSVSVVNSVGGTGLIATKVLTYVNGQSYFTERFRLVNSGSNELSATVFLGSDIFLASSDNGVPFRDAATGSTGGRTCANVTPEYTILHFPLTPADRYTAVQYNSVWTQIGAGQLNNVVGTGCIDNGAALQWNVTVPVNGSVTILAATSFGPVPSIPPFNITDVNPAQATIGSTVPVTISGFGFQAGTTFTVELGDVTVTNLVINSPTSATAVFNIAPTAAPGFRDLYGVQSPGGLQATLVDGFAVSEPPVWNYSVVGFGNINTAAFTCIRNPTRFPGNPATNRPGWATDEGQFYHEDPNSFGGILPPVGLARAILDCVVAAWDPVFGQLASIYCWDSPSPQYIGDYPFERNANLRIYFASNGQCNGPLPGGTVFEQNVTMARELFYPVPMLRNGFE